VNDREDDLELIALRVRYSVKESTATMAKIVVVEVVVRINILVQVSSFESCLDARCPSLGTRRRSFEFYAA
jgi:hypothetical protein